MGSKGAKSRHQETSHDLEGSGRFPAPGFFGAISFYGLLVTILLSAIPYGSAQVWHKSLLIVAIAVFAGFRVIDCMSSRTFRIAESALLLPLAGVLSLALVQAVKWPGLSSPISAAPYETKSFILIFGAIVIAAELLFFYTNTKHRLKWLLALVLAAGVGSSIFGLLREMAFDPQSELLAGYFSFEQGFAQFINRNHFALLIEMSFGLLLGILLKGELSEKFRFLYWIIAGILAYSLVAANSRGGLVSMAALTLFAISVHVMTREDPADIDREYRRRVPLSTGMLVRRISLTAGLLALVFSFIVFAIAFVGGDTVVTRFEKLKGEFETAGTAGVNRNLIWTSTFDMIKTEPLVGVGFGGYGAAITKFDTSGGKYSLQQAHNDYLEILSNGGIVGFALFALFGVMAARRIWKNFRSSDPLIRSSCFGAAIGIFGVLIHSFVDFGLHIPVNALIFTVLVVIATVNLHGAEEGQADARSAILRTQE